MGPSVWPGPEQGVALGGSRWAVKVTVPVGTGPPWAPVTVAVSETVWPTVTVPLTGVTWVAMVGLSLTVTFSFGSLHGVMASAE